MNETYPKDIEVLISGYLDGELSDSDRRKLEGYLSEHPSLRKEFEAMNRIVIGTSESLAQDMPPQEVWDTFSDRLYNRLERKTGWLIFILGVTAITLYSIYLFITQPWSSAVIKTLIAVPILGLTILFISVLRQRLLVAKTDRYTRDIIR